MPETTPKVGDRVKWTGPEGTTGTVKEILSDGGLFIQWDHGLGSSAQPGQVSLEPPHGVNSECEPEANATGPRGA
jgi:hypothetical protein